MGQNDVIKRGGAGELWLVFAMVGILVVLFLPIPAALLDFLLLTNLSFGLLILLLTFYMDRPLSFSTFPSLLLITTLFRLALNISATRLILADADAGRVISTIGDHVVGGNYVIGLIVFLILVVVQYVVVTNGAQRVAEVAARFTLDAMPGKQMSIDAELNMGLIDEKQARARRHDVEREANFYGAMDGASKFVKGDAIAGIIILLINIIGGLSVGIAQKGMGWQEALHTYTLLTVGDGIVTQIPALVIATATGMIVTRAATDAHLATEVAKQLSLSPTSFWLVSAVLLIVMFIPGIPAFPVAVLLVAAVVCAFLAKARRERETAVSQQTETAEAAEADVYETLSVEPIELAVGSGILALIGDEQGTFMERIKAFRKQYALDMGLVLPNVRIREQRKLSHNGYEIRVFGVRAGFGELYADRTLAINPGNVRGDVQGIDTKDPSFGLAATWILEAQKGDAKNQGYTLVEPVTVLFTHFSEVVKQHAASLLTRGEVERLVTKTKEKLGSLVDELIPHVMTLSDVQKVLQNLLAEKVSIRHLELVLEVLVDRGKTIKDPDALTEIVRQRLAPQLCQSLAKNANDLSVLTLDPALEHQLVTAVRKLEERSTLILEPKTTEQLLQKLSASAESMMKSNLLPVVLCTPTLRKPLRTLTQRAMPHLHVLSLSEIPTSIGIRSFGMVAV